MVQSLSNSIKKAEVTPKGTKLLGPPMNDIDHIMYNEHAPGSWKMTL